MRVTTASGESTTVVPDLAGHVDVSSTYALSTRRQPMVLPRVHDVSVVTTTGDQLIPLSEEATELRTLHGST